MGHGRRDYNPHQLHSHNHRPPLAAATRKSEWMHTHDQFGNPCWMHHGTNEVAYQDPNCIQSSHGGFGGAPMANHHHLAQHHENHPAFPRGAHLQPPASVIQTPLPVQLLPSVQVLPVPAYVHAPVPSMPAALLGEYAHSEPSSQGSSSQSAISTPASREQPAHSPETAYIWDQYDKGQLSFGQANEFLKIKNDKKKRIQQGGEHK